MPVLHPPTRHRGLRPHLVPESEEHDRRPSSVSSSLLSLCSPVLSVRFGHGKSSIFTSCLSRSPPHSLQRVQMYFHLLPREE
ncbi:hypothetical protein ACN42_g10623 [Penicillium freii]|uniref:Uncharacterized protein n=1 Tax=Penicillium freii TaxID=48697 RepID=A0A101M9Q4_PENFR|nr:hypothetical protein ACN42_g10623 [Penicillium freii]